MLWLTSVRCISIYLQSPTSSRKQHSSSALSDKLPSSQHVPFPVQHRALTLTCPKRKKPFSEGKHRPEQTAGQGDRYILQNILSKRIKSSVLTAVFWGQQEAGLQGQAPTSPAMLQWCVSRLIFSQHSWNVSSLVSPVMMLWSRVTVSCSGMRQQPAHPTAGEGSSHSFSCGIPDRPQVWEHSSWDNRPGTQMGHGEMATGSCAQQSWTAAAVQPGGFSSSAFHFCSPLWLPSQLPYRLS